MQHTRLASRYAKSLLDLAIENGKEEEVYADMVLLEKTCTSSREFEVLLKSPVVKADKKEAILKAVFKGNVSKLSEEFINIITRKGREAYLVSIASSFLQQYKNHKNITTASIVTAVPLDKSLKEKILGIIGDNVSGEVELEERVDKDLIGGFVLRVGDQQVDSSVRHKLNQLEQNFKKNPYVKEF